MKGDKILIGILLLFGLFAVMQVAEIGANESSSVADNPTIQVSKQSLSQVTNYTKYGAMIINNDTELEQIASLQGFAGNGTVENPYIIDGFNFSGIYIANTRKHIIITNSVISAPLTNIGFTSFILLSNVSNVAIQENMIALPGFKDSTSNGIEITQSSNVTVSRNSIDRVLKGVHVTYSNNTIISENWITTLSNNIHVFASSYVTIRNNTLTSTDFLSIRFSILIENSARTSIFETIIENSSQGLRLYNIDRVFANGFKMIAWDFMVSTIPITSVEVMSANNTILSGFDLQDQRFQPNQQQPYDISTGFFVHEGYLSNFTIANSTINGMARAVEFSRNSGQDVFIQNIVVMNAVKAVVIMGNNADFARITVAESTFMNITDWESVRIDQQTLSPISDVRIIGNLFLTPTTRRVEIFTWNIQNVFVYRNNFFTQYGLSSGFDDALWAFIDTINVTVTQNYYQHIKGQDFNNDGYYDTSFSRDGYIDFFPATKPWPSWSFPLLYSDAQFEQPKYYDVYYIGEILGISWLPATDTHGTNYTYNLLWINRENNASGTILSNTKATSYMWTIPQLERGVYGLVLEVVNASDSKIVSRIESVSFAIQMRTTTSYSGTHSDKTDSNKQTQTSQTPQPPQSSQSTQEPTIPSLEIPVGGNDLFAIPLVTLFLLPALRRRKKNPTSK